MQKLSKYVAIIMRGINTIITGLTIIGGAMLGITERIKEATGRPWAALSEYGCFGATTTINGVRYCAYPKLGDSAAKFHVLQSWRNKHGELRTSYAEAKTMDELAEWLKYEMGEMGD